MILPYRGKVISLKMITQSQGIKAVLLWKKARCCISSLAGNSLTTYCVCLCPDGPNTKAALNHRWSWDADSAWEVVGGHHLCLWQAGSLSEPAKPQNHCHPCVGGDWWVRGTRLRNKAAEWRSSFSLSWSQIIFLKVWSTNHLNGGHPDAHQNCLREPAPDLTNL